MLLGFICHYYFCPAKDKTPKIKEQLNEETKQDDRPKAKSRGRQQESPNLFEWMEDMLRQGRYRAFIYFWRRSTKLDWNWFSAHWNFIHLHETF